MIVFLCLINILIRRVIKPNKELRFFKCFKFWNHSLLVKAFITYVRPILEYDCNVWSPLKLIHIDKLEYVQRYFTKRLTGIYNLSNGECSTKSWFRKFEGKKSSL